MGTDPERTFLANLDLIEDVIRFIARRNRCRHEEAEEFASVARLKLVEDGYGVLRKFGGRSSLRTYLTTVLHRVFLDYRTQQWGKWRPSAAARKIGDVAVRLEALLHRDGRSLDEARAILRQRDGLEVSAAELAVMAAALPARTSRRMEGEEMLANVATADGAAETNVAEDERRREAQCVQEALHAALAGLPPEERLALRLKFQDGFTARQIASALQLDERQVYKRLDRLLERLRQELEARGVTGDRAVDTFGDDAWPAAWSTPEGKTAGSVRLDA